MPGEGGEEEGERKAWRARIDRGEECVMGGIEARRYPHFPIFEGE